MRHILIFFSVLLLICTLLISNLTFAQEKQTAALAPMGALGELDEIEKRIIFNSLQESLSKYYTLTSQKMYEKAEEEAFQVMDSDECTEEQCIAIIQELLQVEYFFMFEILKSGNFQQLKITRIDIDSNRDVRTATCEDCNISKTNSKVDDLVKSVSKEFKIQEKGVAGVNRNLDSQEVLAEERGAKELEPFWEKQSCKESFNTNNFYGAEKYIISRPYGVNRITGKLVEDHDEHLRLIKEGNLIGSDESDTEDDLNNMRYISSSSSHVVFVYSYLPSLSSNSNCYETLKQNTVAKRFIKINKQVLQVQISRGKGDHLEALSSILGCTDSVKITFNKLMQKNYETIYNKSTYPEIEARSIMFEVNKIINSDPWLAGNCNGYSPVNVVATREAEYLGIL